ncbi:DUF6291 domain-containing protein [Berryella intestinalis]|uniref:DUF6291 domain-containing protein n=1 Tax=Berryella intestinalis TaxID=1531429 RepID=UPI001F11A6A8|nr:DUF6291 domain-containing protein [Berryella intestinalis]
MYIQDDYWEAAQSLTAAQRRDFVSALVEYHYTGEAPNLSGVTKAMFTLCRDRIDAAKRSVENGRSGGRPKTSGFRKSAEKESPRVPENAPKEKPRRNPRVSENASETETQAITQTITQTEPALLKSESEIKETTPNGVEKKAAARRFTAPTPAEVSDYAAERGIAIDAERFCDFYASKGWRVGNSPMRDWRAAARNWAARDGASAPPGPPPVDPELAAAIARW